MGSNPLHALRLHARELLRVPGTVREVDAELAAGDLGIVDDRINGPIGVAVTATSAIDGVVVAGTLSVPWHTSCRRCLVDVSGVEAVAIDEVYRDEVADVDDAFPIDGDQIDLAPAIREHVLLGLPDNVVCRDDCAGICPVCGIDRNLGSCECDTTVRDERWAALDDLDLDE